MSLSYFINFYISHNGENIEQGLAEYLVSSLSSGEAFTLDECKQYGDEINIKWDDVSVSEFYLAMNYIYTVYHDVINKQAINVRCLYAELTRAWMLSLNTSLFRFFLNDYIST